MNNETIVGKHVKCFLRNTMTIEGIAEEWTDTRVVLSSLEGESLMIIHNPTDDILMTKVILSEESPKEEPPQQHTPKTRESIIKEKLEEALAADPDLQKKTVAELHEMILEQEKQIIANKTKEHFGSAGSAKLTRYSSPYMPGSRIPKV